MLDFHNPGIVFVLLVDLLRFHDSFNCSISLTVTVGVSDLNVKEGILSFSVKGSCSHIGPCVWFRVDRLSEGKSITWLKRWFNLNVVADFLQQRCLIVSDVVMTFVDETTTMAIHGMCDCVLMIAWTLRREVFQWLIVSKVDSILKFAAMKVEVLVFQGTRAKPT